MKITDYQIIEDGKQILTPSFCITLFTNEPIGSDLIPEGLLTPYHNIVNDFRESFFWASYDFDQRCPEAVTNTILGSPDRWLSDSDSRSKDSAFISLYGGKSPRCLSFPFFYWHYENSYRTKKYRSDYRLELPVYWNDDLNTIKTEEYIAKIIGNYPLVCGYAGYTISCDQEIILSRDDLQQYIYQWYQRYPGFMNIYPDSESQALMEGPVLFAIGWITILGEYLCTKMGGIDELRHKLSHIPDVTVKSLPQKGALIRIGDKPQLGDIRNKDMLDNYRAVGHALSVISVNDFDKQARNIVVEGFRDMKESAHWLGRFFL